MKRVGLVTIITLVAILGAVGAIAFAAAPTTPAIDGSVGVDWDADELVFDDIVGETPWGVDNDLDNLYVTWDASNMYVAVSYTVSGNGMVVYVDTGASGGETDFNSANGYGGAYPRNLTFGAANDIDMLLARWDHNDPQIYTVVDNASTEVTGSATFARTDNGTATVVEFAIPWTLMGAGLGDQICLVATIVGGDDFNGPDAMPTNASMDGAGGPSLISNFHCFTAASGGVVINEFYPKGTEWVELYNVSGVTLTLSGWYVDDADCGSGTSTIGAVDLPPNGYFVVGAGDAGDNFGLSNVGDNVVLCDATDTELDRVGYGDGGSAPLAFASIARVADGIDTNDDGRDWNVDLTPTQGTANDPSGTSLGVSVLLNEIDTEPISGNDQLELYNPTGTAVDLTGWFVSDGDDVANISGTLSIPAGGYVALDAGTNLTTPVNFTGSDVAYLYDSSFIRVDQFGWSGESEVNCFARVPDGAGPNDGYNWTSAGGGTTLLDQVCTFGRSNVLPVVEMVVDKNAPTTILTGTTSLTYTIDVQNTGNTTATNVILTDTLPVSATYQSDNIGMSTNPSPGVYVWNLGGVPTGTLSYELVVSLAPTLPSGTILQNNIIISTDDITDTVAGNSDTAVTQILAPFAADPVLDFTRIGGYAGSGAEIAAHDPVSQTLFVATGGGTMEILDISDPFSPTLKSAIAIAPTYGASANSVDIHDGLVAVAVGNITPTLPGKVVFFDRDGAYLNDVTVGALPDMLTFTPDGQMIVVANEGEPGTTDPEGSVSVVDLSGGAMGATVTELDFTHFMTTTIDPDVRIFPGKTVAEDVEPEYITVSPDGSTAWVVLQENNSVAVVDMQAMTITAVLPLGYKDHSLAGNELDASDSDGGINIANWPVFGMYMPDAIASYEANGNVYLITANEGDARNEDDRVGNLALDPVAFPSSATLQLDANLGRLHVSTIDGDVDGDGDYDELYSYSGRSFTIWDGSTGALVYDSGSEFERATAVLSPATFNSNGSAGSFDTRSDDKGPEAEGVTKGVINGRTYAFIGLERIGGIMVYDVTDPTMPYFINYLPPQAGDISPEGLLYIDAADSPTGNPLLVVSYEFSGSMAVFEITFAADVAVVKTAPFGAIGEELQYTVVISNDASAVAQSVVFTDTFGSGLTYVSDDSGITPVNPSAGVYVWSLGDLPPSTAVAVHITATVDAGLSSGSTVTNTANISTASAGDDPADNNSVVTTEVFPLVPITQVQQVPDPVSDDQSPLLGQTVWVEGIVTAQPGEVDVNQRLMFIQDAAGGPWSGLAVFRAGDFPAVYPEGTIVRALGDVDEFFGLTQLNLSSSPWAVTVMGTTAPPAPEVLTTAQFDDVDAAVSEQWESVLLEFQNTTVTDDDLGNSEWYFSDGSGNARADDLGDRDGNLTYVPVNGEQHQYVRGVGHYSFSNYKLQPRSDADIAVFIAAPQLSKAAPVLVQPGELFTYTITAENFTGQNLTNVVITDAVPVNATFAYALDGGMLNGNVVEWMVGPLPDQGSAQVRFAVTATLSSGAEISNNDYQISSMEIPTPTVGPQVTTIVDTALRIRSIQGARHLSLLDGRSVQAVHGIITAIDSGDGFYMQDPAPDGDIATSEGIFVETSFGAISVGDEVLVDGTVAEDYPGGDQENLPTTLIENAFVTVVSSGNPLPAPIILGTNDRVPPNTVIDDDVNGNVATSGTFDADTDGLDFYESVEGMLVQVENAIVVGSNRFGEIAVVGDNGANAGLLNSRGGIVIQPGDFNPERIIIDDGLVSSEPDVTVGDSFSGVITGVVDYSFGNFKLLNPAPLPAVVSGGTVSETTTLVGTADHLRVASMNVENLSPDDSATDFAGLANQIVNGMESPDILGLQEIQDNSGETDDGVIDGSLTYQTLITAIVAAGGPTYEFREIAPENNQDGGVPGGNIRVGFLFNPARVTFVDRPGGGAITATVVTTGPTGDVQLSASPGRIDPTNIAFFDSRKVLVGEFVFNGNKVFVIAGHFNSKSGDSPLFGSFQPPVLNSEVQRLQQAQVVNDFVDSILALDADANVVIAGDLNDFQFSPPLNTLQGGVLNNLLNDLPVDEQYTYIFDGNSQVLDHILVSDNLLNNAAAEADVVHMNAEFDSDFRPTDHDPVLAQMLLPVPDITITMPADGAIFTTTNGADVSVTVVVDTSPGFNLPQQGHWHIWVDGTMVGPVFGYTTTVDLSPGTHVITAELRSPTHVPLGPVDSVTVTVNTIYTLHMPAIFRLP